MEQTIESIQKFAKILRVIAKIVMTASLVGLCLCAVTLGWTVIVGGFRETMQVGSVTLYGPMSLEGNPTDAQMWGNLAFVTAEMAFVMAIAARCGRLFGNMQTGRTPFTMENALLLKKLAVLMIVAAIVPVIVGQSAGMTAAELTGTVFSGDYASGFSLLVVLLFFALSVVFKYGCQLQQQVDETL